MSHLLPLWMVGPLACGALLGALGVGLRAQAAPAPAPSGWQISGQFLQGWDDNVLLALAQPQADTTSQLQLNLLGNWAGPRSTFNAVLTPVGMSYGRHPQLDYVAGSYSQDWQYALGPHTKMNWSAQAARFPERGGMPSMGGFNLAAAANASQTMGLNEVLNTGATNWGLTHQYSRRASWNANLSFNDQLFQVDTALAASGGAGAFGTARSSQSRSLEGGLGWSYQFSPATALLLGFTDSEIWFLSPSQHSRYANLQASLSHKLGSDFSVQAGVGPAWNWMLGGTTAPGFAGLPQRSYAANLSLSMQTGHSQYGVSWQHSDQLGLTPGGLTTDAVALQYNAAWGRSWSGSASLGRSAGAMLASGSSAGPALDSTFVSGEVLLRVGTEWSLFATSSFNSQNIPSPGAAAALFRHAQVALGITFAPGSAR